MFRKLFPLILLFLFAAGQEARSQSDTTNLAQLRTQSGVDPTRVVTKLVYSVWYYDRADDRSQINNRINFTLGVNRWSFSLKPELITRNDLSAGNAFQTKAGDLRFSVLNAFFVKGKHALAGAAEFTLPTGSEGFGNQYFSVNPSLTYAYTLDPSLFLAFQPQYTFDLSKAGFVPDLNVLTIRTFIAKFLQSGWFFVFEPRIVNDFENNQFDFIVAPIIGKSLGGGFNLTSVLEVPTKKETLDNRGLLVQFGITKNF
ncbi:transporter [Lentiprolixibacter aurantiacus]|uniref:Transporter n=1 Tax=Lentiprolixibacter aurantiacus TaxID=2993939 RepID=A0AAE3MNT0_9FLAO|nr:transporter [Lentiprolixibacter aurantiacus]MCX2720608.1 transporter [Lentiprolixibacter aurantiacus]